MGNRMHTCCRTNMELDDETPPDLPGQLAPTIPDHLDREFRSQVHGGSASILDHLDAEFGPFAHLNGLKEHGNGEVGAKVHWQDVKVKTPKPSSDVAIQALPSIAGFHHEASICAPQDLADRRTTPAPIGWKLDASVGSDTKETNAAGYNGVLDSVLGSVLDRCYLFCYEREWRTWQSQSAVGSKGSRAFSVSQAHALARMELGRFEDLGLAMVIELDMVPGGIVPTGQGQELALVGPISINAVRVVYWLQDFVLVSQASEGRIEPVPNETQERGVGGDVPAPSAEQTIASERISFQEYSWLLDDFDDMLVRRKIAVSETVNGSLEAARARRREREEERLSAKHVTVYSSRLAARLPMAETNQTLRALREQPTFPQIARPRRPRVPDPNPA